MESITKIAGALVKAQKAFGPALKTSNNPHFRSKYADLSACIEAVIDGLNDNGIALIQKQHPHDGGVAVETIFVHESGETLSAGLLVVPASKQDPQGYGSALTYARRYSLMAACGIAPEDDDGNAASKRKPEPKSEAISATAEAWKECDEDTKRHLTKVAKEVAGCMPDAGKALEVLESADLTNEHKAALWHLLDSATRSAIKKAKETT